MIVVGTATVEWMRKRAVLEGISAALDRSRPQEGISRHSKLDGRGEAHLVTLAFSEPPKGFARWTLTLLADKLVELNVVESISRTTIHIKPWAVKRFCIPPEHSGAFVHAMEDVVDADARIKLRRLYPVISNETGHKGQSAGSAVVEPLGPNAAELC